MLRMLDFCETLRYGRSTSSSYKHSTSAFSSWRKPEGVIVAKCKEGEVFANQSASVLLVYPQNMTPDVMEISNFFCWATPTLLLPHGSHRLPSTSYGTTHNNITHKLSISESYRIDSQSGHKSGRRCLRTSYPRFDLK